MDMRAISVLAAFATPGKGKHKHTHELGQSCRTQGDEVSRCVGKGAVLRIAFGNFLFFAPHCVLLLGARR